ncbi:HEAT repeat protein-like protein [Amniculicola lignicola CBS 123094]|uniref:HEAT repeat protein-like protein n=1 Tax=Amniculicola lignicola CBS 123094 TaxID=1392246 RepID=A0A6A5WNE3_9PLEO|nr:HEAT repeat protein-like protein [Amniculicola lignicola CBS 123094]
MEAPPPYEPLPERNLRELSKDIGKVLPRFSEVEEIQGVKELHDLVLPVLETADRPDLPTSHRAAATNALCGIIQACQDSGVQYAQKAALGDLIWFKLLDIFLQRSDNTKGKSMRQTLLVLTSVLQKDRTDKSTKLAEQAISIFIEIVCFRRDRLKVKAALQGLAHFLLKDVVPLSRLIELYEGLHPEPGVASESMHQLVQSLLSAFLSWAVHHDTSLAAGNLIKSFLTQLRRSSFNDKSLVDEGLVWPLWIEPVVKIISQWPDRLSEFHTHVFPHCFMPHIDEFLNFLSFLHFGSHLNPKSLPDQLCNYSRFSNGLDEREEFNLLLAAIQSGKELGIIKDIDGVISHDAVEVRGDCLAVSDNMFKSWIFHPETEIRLAGLFLLVHSTAVTKPITCGVLESIRRNLPHLHTDTDANSRQELLAQTSRLLDRMRGSSSSIVKSTGKQNVSDGVRLQFPHAQVMKRYNGSSSTHPETQLIVTLGFIDWYIKFLEWELRPSASYQRRTTALRAMVILLRSGLDHGIRDAFLSKQGQGQLRWAHGMKLATPKLLRLLFDLLLDPFEDIRSASAVALALCIESLDEKKKLRISQTFPNFLGRAEVTMLQTGRADQADGVARSYALLFTKDRNTRSELSVESRPKGIETVNRLVNQLESTISLANKNLPQAVNGRPVHGIIAALRYIIDENDFYSEIESLNSEQRLMWKGLHDRVCGCFEVLWDSVKSVLCADAPEGHVPEDVEDANSLDTKEVLSYSWRGLKEASMLLRTIVAKAPISTQESAILSAGRFEILGKLTFTQLTDLRHRGAFSTVAQTFAVFCRRCVSSSVAELQGLLEKWYLETLLCIQDKASSITRRSAGIPSLMAGIISAEPQPGGKLFSRAMRDLIYEASQDALSSNIEESRLPQVHALNCVKDIFTTSKLSVPSEAYIGECLDLAARTLNSKIWPIRNCGLMLFKALIERLLGSDEAQDWKELERTKTSRFSYENFPSLTGILSALLDPEGPLRATGVVVVSTSPFDLHGAEGVFPALQILQQAPPPEEERSAISALVLNLVKSPHWHLRDMAARTLVALQRPDEYFETMIALLSSVQGSHNAQHGFLLSIKYMLRKYLRTQYDEDEMEDFMTKLSVDAGFTFNPSMCQFTGLAFLDIVNTCATHMSKQSKITKTTSQAWSKLAKPLQRARLAAGPLPVENGLYQRSAAVFDFFLYILPLDDATISIQPASSGQMTVQDQLLILAEVDPDACMAALDTLADILLQANPEVLVISKSALVTTVHHIVLKATNAEVQSKAQLVLAEALQILDLRSTCLEEMNEAQVMASIELLERQCLCGSPSNLQGALRLLGHLLDHAFHAYPTVRQTISTHVARCIRLLRMNLTDDNPFDIRFAAVQSMTNFHHIWAADTKEKATSTLALGLALVVYDQLNDDDDEIRDAAALVTTRILRLQNFRPNLKDAVPLISAQRLATFLVTAFSHSPHLVKEGIRRVIGVPSIKALFQTSFEETFQLESRQDTALFSVEKQNLYKDDTLDIALWSRILTSLSPNLVSSATTSDLTKWVLGGLYVLISTAENAVDGPLGWTSKAEIFALGMRVICGAEVLLEWRVSGGDEVKLALRRFADVGIKTEVHGLWLEKIEKVLEGDVLRGLKEVFERLPRA